MISAGLRYNGIDGRIPPIVFTGHHLSHAASVFYASGFDRSLIYVTDGMGDDLSTSLWIGEGKSLRSIKKFYFPNSLGEFYAAFTEFLGFEPYSHEGKLMGLAAYGEKDDEIIEKIKKHIISYHNGKYQVNSLYTVNGAHDYGERFTNLLVDLFGSPRLPEAKIETFHFNLAHAAQALLEQASENVLGYYMKKTGIKDVCISGGVGMNCKMNGHLLHALPIEKIFINPASNDAGSAMGAALALSMQKGVDPRFTMTHACFGPGFSSVQVEAVLKEARVKYRKSKNIPEDAAKALAQGKIIGWHQGRQEAGARALGSRSILASPLSKSMIDKINKNVKHREPWRPFAPSLLAECAGDYYSLGKMSPFMILAFTVNKDKRRIIPAVTHIDNTCRPQTVTRSDNPRYYDLIRAFEKKTGVPVILNTSFNVRGEPIVSTPADSLRCFFATGIEQLFIEDFIVEK
ncbi:MAG TPA: nodulation protein [Spirochaetia bacterium]|nr:nodulation protein [Spirochaetia bacterium]